MWCCLSSKHKLPHHLILPVSKAVHISSIICAPCRSLQSAKTSLLAVLVQKHIRVWIHQLIQRKDGFTIPTASNTADSAESRFLLRIWDRGREMDWVLLSICGHQADCSVESKFPVSNTLQQPLKMTRVGSASFRPLTGIAAPCHYAGHVATRPNFQWKMNDRKWRTGFSVSFKVTYLPRCGVIFRCYFRWMHNNEITVKILPKEKRKEEEKILPKKAKKAKKQGDRDWGKTLWSRVDLFYGKYRCHEW